MEKNAAIECLKEEKLNLLENGNHLDHLIQQYSKKIDEFNLRKHKIKNEINEVDQAIARLLNH
ncbi:hypothetical protein [Bacillus mesophilum]|uniref:Uncharacterized protein n=1 Tax=Bacillus mesophilum TaxID=1071718 RepID=A0A7V7UWJ2_9BACI|nr:hypothetical protein [Bacillus mesophilum]KAB2334271.1 hypothetical protein F7732_09380 [Bacillus mesophilum]